MKKLICALFLILMMAGTSFAETGAGVDNINPIGFTKSNNVLFVYQSAGTPVDRYTIATKNTAGDKTYGTTSASGTIYYSNALGAGTALTAGKQPSIPNSATDSVVTGGASGWVSM
jgi:hypothetical protein